MGNVGKRGTASTNKQMTHYEESKQYTQEIAIKLAREHTQIFTLLRPACLRFDYAFAQIATALVCTG